MPDLVKRERLYDLVWSVPMSSLCRQLEMSDCGLAKLCARESIPVPSRGYWAKLEYGKPATRTPLGPIPEGRRDWIAVAPAGSELGAEGREWMRQEMAPLGWDDPTAQAHELEEPAHDHDLHVLARDAIRVAGRVRVRSSELSPLNRHPEVERMLTAGCEASFRFPFPANPFRGSAPSRRLAFLNALLLTLDQFGAQPSITDSRAEGVSVRFGHIVVRCRLKSTSTKSASGERTERLHFQVFQGLPWERERFLWGDRRGGKIEEHLREVVVGVVLSAELERRDRDWQEYREALKRREERRREQDRNRDELRQAARKQLVQQAEATRQASAIRELVAAVRRSGWCDDPKVARWLGWALDQADAVDPVRGGSLTFDVPE